MPPRRSRTRRRHPDRYRDGYCRLDAGIPQKRRRFPAGLMPDLPNRRDAAHRNRHCETAHAVSRIVPDTTAANAQTA